jgi:hypothetical protein
VPLFLARIRPGRELSLTACRAAVVGGKSAFFRCFTSMNCGSSLFDLGRKNARAYGVFDCGTAGAAMPRPLDAPIFVWQSSPWGRFGGKMWCPFLPVFWEIRQRRASQSSIDKSRRSATPAATRRARRLEFHSLYSDNAGGLAAGEETQRAAFLNYPYYTPDCGLRQRSQAVPGIVPNRKMAS